MQLSGNTILITGGTSGIGKALALRFLELGNTVIITGRNQEALDLLKRKHTALFCFYADLSKQNDVKQLIQWGLDHFPQLNVVINNAGVQFNYIFDGSPEINRQTENEIAVNLTAPILINNGLIPLLLKQSDAAIVNVSSGLAIAPKKNGAVYCATKSGLHAYTLALRYQLENGPVRVFEIIPPLVDTAMTKGRGRGKISPDDLVHEFLNDFKKNKPESYIRKTKILKTIYRLWPSAAYRIMKNGR